MTLCSCKRVRCSANLFFKKAVLFLTESPQTDLVRGLSASSLMLLLCIQRTLACFCRRLRQSAIMAMNSEFVGLPLMFETV